jgi:formate-dependent nitrite reductase membrane component NrfD
VLFKEPRGQMFSLYIVWYLFFAGAGSGAYALAVFFGLSDSISRSERFREYHEITRGGFYLGPILVVFGVVFLLFDLGSPAKAYTIFLSTKFTYLTFGSWAVLLLCALSTSLALLQSDLFVKLPRAIFRAFEVLSLLLALSVMIYTGVFISSMPSVPFLNTPLITALFVISSFSAGAAVITLYGFFNQQRKSIPFGLKIIPRIDIVLILLEMVVLVILILLEYFEGGVSAKSVNVLLLGAGRYAFWIGVVFIGFIIPLVAGLFTQRSPHMVSQAISSSALLIGSLALRYSLILAGLHVATTQFAM